MQAPEETSMSLCALEPCVGHGGGRSGSGQSQQLGRSCPSLQDAWQGLAGGGTAVRGCVRRLGEVKTAAGGAHFRLCCYCAWIFFSLNLFLEREEGKEKGGEKLQRVVASHAPPTGDLARNPGVCPGWEPNPGPFGSQARAQSIELHQPGPCTWISNRAW